MTILYISLIAIFYTYEVVTIISTIDHADEDTEKCTRSVTYLHQGRDQVNAIAMGDFDSIVGEDLQIRW